jgi:hypothetical protein
MDKNKSGEKNPSDRESSPLFYYASLSEVGKVGSFPSEVGFIIVVPMKYRLTEHIEVILYQGIGSMG